MDSIRKLSGVGFARIGLVAILTLALGGFYLSPLGEAVAGWIFVKEGPTVTIGPTPVPNKSGTNVTIAGIGFEPNQELGLRLMMGGAMSDVRFQVTPEPKTDAEGNFAVVWRLRRELRLLEPGAHKFMVVNDAGDVLAVAPLVIGPKAAKAKK